MWKTGKYKGYWWEAKVYDEGSRFGINNGRVSKLQIRKDKEIIYNYDRGLDVDKLQDRKVLSHILSLYKEL